MFFDPIDAIIIFSIFRIQVWLRFLIWLFLLLQEIMESTFRGIVSDELKKIKLLPLNGQMGISPTEISDVWEYDGPHEGTQENDSEELLIEMQRLLYEDLREELIQRGIFKLE